jgi:hypothetical protein
MPAVALKRYKSSAVTWSLKVEHHGQFLHLTGVLLSLREFCTTSPK